MLSIAGAGQGLGNLAKVYVTMLLGSGKLFEDEEFVPSNDILTNDIQGKTIRINYMGKTHDIFKPRKKSEIKWLRPKVFMISRCQCFEMKLCEGDLSASRTGGSSFIWSEEGQV